MKNNIREEFSNPSNEYRGKPFWSWNGKLEKDELLRQIEVMKEMGFGGYFMHSRTGLETEYLGEEWFELINECASYGEKLGLESWLYDEDRWPSGTAGGMVTKDPNNRMKFLVLNKINGDELEWSDNTLGVFIVEYDNLILDSYRRIYRETKKEEYIDKALFEFKYIEMEKSSFYNGYTYLDTINKDATDAFIESTHEKYKENCKESIKTSIKGIFTDEPHRGQLMSTFGSGSSLSDVKKNAVPWTYKLFEEFKDAFGYDVQDRLPELFLWYKGKRVSEVKWHYVEILQRLFIDNFAKPIYKWCNDNDLILTGHILHEDSLTAQTAMSGSVMRYYEYMEYPGVDVLTEYVDKYFIVKQLSSVARQLNKKWMLSELYGCTGWQFSFESHKNVGDWQALFGINLRCHHLSWYTMKGQAKRDYPASILHQSNWYNEYKYVEDYFSRLGVILSKGEPICNTLVINPIESVWCQVYPGWCSGLDAADDEIIAIEEKYSKLFKWLCANHIDFDYGDEDILSRHYRILEDEDGNSVLCVGNARYRQVIIGGMTTIRKTTLEIINKFLDKSGEVIFAGELPRYVNALLSDEAVALAKNAKCVDFDEESIIDATYSKSGNVIKINNSNGEANKDIYVQSRYDDENTYIVILNTNRKEEYKDILISFDTSNYVEEWSAMTKERFYLGKGKNGSFSYSTDIPRGGEKIFILSKVKDEGIELKKEYMTTKKVEIKKDEYEYTLDEANICVLDIASYSFDGKNFTEYKEILKIDNEIRDYYKLDRRGGEMYQPWFVNQNGYKDEGKVFIAYDFYVDKIPKDDVYLIIESKDEFNAKLNGKDINLDNSYGWFIDICFEKIKIDKNELLVGKNRIMLETTFNKRTDLEAIYIIGDFSVSIDGFKKSINELSSKIAIGDITKQGLAFYSGRITYHLDVDVDLLPDEKAYISIRDFEGALIKVKGDGIEDRVIAWSPYEADITDHIRGKKRIDIEVLLTRRNTFGPLHLVPKRSKAYGPVHFMTENDAFSINYELIESGMLSKPEIYIKKCLYRL